MFCGMVVHTQNLVRSMFPQRMCEASSCSFVQKGLSSVRICTLLVKKENVVNQCEAIHRKVICGNGGTQHRVDSQNTYLWAQKKLPAMDREFLPQSDVEFYGVAYHESKNCLVPAVTLGKAERYWHINFPKKSENIVSPNAKAHSILHKSHQRIFSFAK